MEYLKVGHSFSQAYVLNGNFKLVAYTDYHTAFGCAIKFGNRKFVDICFCDELFSLLKSILAS